MLKTPNQALGRPTPEEYAQQEKLPVTVVLDNIRSANNVGSFFRTADAFAIERIVLCGICATPPSRDLHKTALGAELSVKWQYEADSTEAVRKLVNEGYIPIAVEQVDGASLLQNFRIEHGARYALIFGNEVDGVKQEVVDLCRGAIEIPQSGTKHSLNVAVSAGAVLWSIYAQYIDHQ